MAKVMIKPTDKVWVAFQVERELLRVFCSVGNKAHEKVLSKILENAFIGALYKTESEKQWVGVECAVKLENGELKRRVYEAIPPSRGSRVLVVPLELLDKDSICTWDS